MPSCSVASSPSARFSRAEDGSNPASPPVTDTTTSTRGFSLPLAEDPSALALGKHDGNLLVGIAAKAGGPIEVAALRAETPLATDELRFELDGSAAEASSMRERMLSHRRSGPRRRTKLVDGARGRLGAPLRTSRPACLRAATRSSPALRGRWKVSQAYRFNEALTSGRGGVVTEYEVQAPEPAQPPGSGSCGLPIRDHRTDAVGLPRRKLGAQLVPRPEGRRRAHVAPGDPCPGRRP